MPQLPSVPDTHPDSAILDSFRIAIAKQLSESLPLTLEQAFSAVDYGKKGEDFTVAIPRFRLPGKVDEIAKQVIDKVGLLFGCFVSAQILCLATKSILPWLQFESYMPFFKISSLRVVSFIF